MTPIASASASVAVYALTQNTGQKITVPDSAKSVQIQCRDGTDLKLGFSLTAVNGSSPAGPYFTIKANSVFKADNLLWVDKTVLYLSCASDSKVAEVLFFS
jgi:hypothetical protein